MPAAVRTTTALSLRLIVVIFGSVTLGLLALACILAGALFEELERLAPKYDRAAPMPQELVRGSVKSHLQKYSDWFTPSFPRGTCDDTQNGFYDLVAMDVDQTAVSFSALKNQVVLVTNVAAFGDLTTSNYQGLNKLMQDFNLSTTYTKSGRGFQVLAFPSNQFSNQAGPRDGEVLKCMRYVNPGNDFKPAFKLFNTVDVNGLNTAPVYQYLRLACVNPASQLVANKHDLLWSPVSQSDLSGDFEKFLVDAKGVVRYRYPNTFSPADLEEDIRELMKE